MRPVEKTDYPEIISWFAARKIEPPNSYVFSDTGMIEPGVGCGFLYLTNSGMGIFDCFISNPQKDRNERIDALRRIASNLMVKAADEYGVKVLVCQSEYTSIQSLAKSLKFQEAGKSMVFVKKL